MIGNNIGNTFMNLTNWAFQQKPKRSKDLLVLIAISNCIVCSGKDEVQVSRIELSEMCNISVPVLVRSIKSLFNEALISIDNRGQGRINVYRLNCKFSPVEKGENQPKFKVVSQDLFSPLKDDKPTFTKYTSEFNYAYSNYPRKVGKFQAFQQYQQLTIEEQQELNSKAPQIVRFYERTENKYIPHLATFIAQKRFHDDLIVAKDKDFNDVLFQCARELSELSEERNDHKQMVEWAW